VSRFTWAIVGGVLALVVISLALAVILQSREPTLDLTTPSGVTLAFVLALQRGEGERAWDLLASSARAQTTRERFLVASSNFRNLYERARLSVENDRVEGDTARLDLVRTFPNGGPFGFGASSVQRQTVRLVREQGEWRVETPPDSLVLLNR
jgi:hypothetical protein